jgi:hypothetical protein
MPICCFIRLAKKLSEHSDEEDDAPVSKKSQDQSDTAKKAGGAKNTPPTAQPSQG